MKKKCVVFCNHCKLYKQITWPPKGPCVKVRCKCGKDPTCDKSKKTCVNFSYRNNRDYLSKYSDRRCPFGCENDICIWLSPNTDVDPQTIRPNKKCKKSRSPPRSDVDVDHRAQPNKKRKKSRPMLSPTPSPLLTSTPDPPERTVNDMATVLEMVLETSDLPTEDESAAMLKAVEKVLHERKNKKSTSVPNNPPAIGDSPPVIGDFPPGSLTSTTFEMLML